MKVAVLSLLSRRAGGLFYSVRWLSKALADQGCRPHIFSIHDQFTEEDRLLWNPLKITTYSGYGPLQFSRRMRSLLRDAGPELVHVHGIWLDRQWASLQWQEQTGGPVIISPRGMLDPWALRNSAWKKKIAGRLFADESLRKAVCLHALCESELESIRAYGLKNPVAVIPNGVELPEIGERSDEDSGQRKKLLFLGRIHPKKGLAELIQAWSMEQGGRQRGWELLIAGWDDGGHESGLKELVRRLGVEDSVSFLGPQYGDRKESLLCRSDAFILPSFSEGLPMSVLEAWSYALPVLMTGQCNIPEGFAAEAAIRVEPDSASLAGGIAQIIRMSFAERQTMGGKGRTLVEDKFTWPKIASEMKAVYEWCMDKGPKPGCLIEN